MPIHVGIVCESCERVYFIPRTDRIEFLAETAEYQFVCPAPCGMMRRFDKQRLAPFSVKTQHYARGYANKGEYELVRTPTAQSDGASGYTGPSARRFSRLRSRSYTSQNWRLGGELPMPVPFTVFEIMMSENRVDSTLMFRADPFKYLSYMKP